MVKYIPYKQLFIYYKSRKNEGVHVEINIGIIAIIVLAIAILAILASGYVKASPNKAYIISGKMCIRDSLLIHPAHKY